MLLYTSRVVWNNIKTVL